MWTAHQNVSREQTFVNSTAAFHRALLWWWLPHGGVRGFRWGRIPGCYVTKPAPHEALKLIARGMLTFDERVVLHRVGRDVVFFFINLQPKVE